MAGEAYVKRYGAGGFKDDPDHSTPVDAAFLNAVETALARLLGADPINNGVQVWSTGLGRMQSILLGNAQIDPAAAIAYSKLALTGAIQAGDIAAAAGIAKSQLAALNIVNADVAAGAALAIAKLAGYPADATKFLAGDGTWAVPSYVLNRPAGIDITLAQGVAETSFFTFSVPGNSMGTNKMLRLTLVGDYLHNNVAGDTNTIRVKFGGTTFFAKATSFSAILGANRQPWVMQLFVINLAATNSQAIFGTINMPEANASAATTGIGTIGGGAGTVNEAGVIGISALATIDTTASQTLDVTAQWSAASANNSWRLRGGALELV